MKLIHSHLREFGQFKECMLNFDPQKPFQLIYGDNESGKTTFTRAYLALLFGIEKNTGDAYLSSHDHLYLEGLLKSHTGQYHQIIREHRLSKKLNAKLQLLFPNVNKSFYTQNFILNDESLQSGAKDLLNYIKQFDLSFFENATGIYEIKAVIKKLENHCQNLFKPRGSKPLINASFEEYEGLIDRENQVLLSYPKFKELSALLEKFHEDVSFIENEKDKLIRSIEECDLYENLFKSIHEIEDLKDQVKLLVEKCSLSKPSFDYETWVHVKEELSIFTKKNDLFNSKKCDLKNRLSELEKELLALNPSEELPDIEPQIESIRRVLKLVESNIHLEVKKKELQQKVVGAENQIIHRLDALGLNLSEVSLGFHLPSDIEYERFNEQTYQVNSLEKQLTSEKKRLTALKSALSHRLNENSEQAHFDLQAYQGIKLKREAASQEIDSCWDDLDLSEIKEKFNLYDSYVKKETQFITNVLQKTEQFIQYKSTLREFETVDKDLLKINEKEAYLEGCKKEIQTVLEHYRQLWKISNLEVTKFKKIYREIPKARVEINNLNLLKRELELLSMELKKVYHLCEETSGLFDKNSSLKSIAKELNFLSKEKLNEQKVLENNKARRAYLLLEVERVKKALKKVEVDQKVLKSSWTQFSNTHCLEQKLEEVSIKKYTYQVDQYFEISRQKRGLQEVLSNEKFPSLRESFSKLYKINSSSESLKKLDFIKSAENLESFKLPNNWSEIQNCILDVSKATREDASLELKKLSEKNSQLNQKIGELNYQLDSQERKKEKKYLDTQIQNVLYSLEHNIQDYLSCMLSLFLLKKAVRDYQEKNQQPLLQKVSQYFRLLTGGKYQSVALNVLDKSSFLTCFTEGRDVSINQLSRGSQDQLFLSLKLALIDQYMKDHEPLPILLDDILVQFDDSRAANTLNVLKEFASKTQIFFLTHNQHILNLIRRELPEELYEVHYLPSRTPSKSTF